MKALLTTLAGIASALALAAPVAFADSGFITDTLGGNGQVQGFNFITDTLGGNGHAKAGVQGYRFITDTLAPGGGRVTAVPEPRGFSWADAAIGAGAVAGSLIMLGAALLAVRRREVLAV